MVVRFTTIYAINVCHLLSCEFESRSWRGVFDTTLCGKVCQKLAVSRWFSLVTSINKTDCHDRTEINTLTLTLEMLFILCFISVIILE